MKMLKALCLIILAASFVSAQKSKVSQNKYVPKIVTRSGWTTPAFAPNLTENIGRTEEIANPSEIPNDFDIKNKEYFLNEERLVQTESCNGRSDVSNKRNTLVVKSFTALEHRGRVFLYAVHYFDALAKNGGVNQKRPTMYVDEDGDGKFKLQCDDRSVYLPRWILEAEKQVIFLLPSDWTNLLLSNAAESFDQRTSVFIENDSEVVSVDAKTFLFNRERLIDFELCARSGSPTTEKMRTQYLADHFRTYEINGRVFAYEFPKMTPLKIPMIAKYVQTKGYREAATGCIEIGGSYVFMDEDGDGTFEQSCARKTLTPLPRWVVDLGQITVKTSE